MRVQTSALALFASAILSASAVAQSQSLANPSKPFDPNSCGPADSAYIRTANETGGVPMFLQRSEAAKSFHLVRESTRDNVSTVFWATGPLESNPQIIKIPVDSITERLTFTFSANAKGAQLKLTPPSGRPITETSPHTELTELNCGRIITAGSPEPGTWFAEIVGPSSGTYWVEVQAQSEIYFITAEFVKVAGRIGHQGLFRIQGQPIAGAAATLRVSLSGKETKSTDFYLVDERGQTIQQLQLYPENEDREFYELTGSVSLPNSPFRVAVTGRDLNGHTYQRFFPTRFHAESVEVSATPGLDELQPGSTTHLALAIRNFGAPRTFKLTVTDAHHFVTSVEPKELALSANESGNAQVDLTVPARIATSVEDDVIVVATSTSGPPTSNSAVIHFLVSAPPASPAASRPH